MRQTALILFAHGSRVLESNAQVRQMAERLDAAIETVSVRVAFLELAEPTLDTVVAGLVAEGVRRVHVLPYFLASGVHVTRDLPELLDAIQKRWPALQVEQWRHVGGEEGFFNWLLSQVNTVCRQM